ncbi:MAG: hypothetical protein WD425_06095 [Nitrospirales bacterium]
MVDLVIGVIGTIIDLVFSFIAPLLIWTGEILLGVFSFGYHRPRLNRDAFKGDNAWMPLKNLSFWVGVVFWVGVGVLWKFFG